jgi:formylglycine-generating enzyme required for sulfatase activity
LPTGEFIMGETKHDKFSTDTERPAHRVDISRPFAIGRFPVTVGEFRAIFPAHAPHDDPTLPAVNLCWDEASAYCEALSLHTGEEYRLPSEAEWEYACRAGSRTAFFTGSELTVHQANYLYSEAGQRVGRGSRTALGHYEPNAFGVHDLHGNVCEWVVDVWHSNYHSAPADQQPWLEGGDADLRVIRGGSWDYLPRLLRSAWRDALSRGTRRDNVGFRVALNLPS